MDEKIDFVITWVDGNDDKWREERAKYSKYNEKIDNSEARYRDWEILKYWFRAVEKNANWVNKVYFVTYGHIPNWMNEKSEKLVIVKHSDFIKKEDLPTFNSCAIEMNLHKIEGLSEKFVYFNDDMYINGKVSPDEFFMNGLPLESPILTPVHPSYDISACIHYNCMKIINKNFKFSKQNKMKLFSFKNGKYLYKNLTLAVYPFCVGYRFHHLPTSFLKSTFDDVWEKESDVLSSTCRNKFREYDDVSQWLFQFWQIASGKFKIRKEKVGKYFDLDKNYEEILMELKKSKHKLICLNDNESIKDFEYKKKKLIETFEIIYPDKSQYEL